MDPHAGVQGEALEERAARGRLERIGMREPALDLLRLDAGEGVLRRVELGVFPETLRMRARRGERRPGRPPRP